MTELLLFHHAQGQTRGFLAFADELRAAGHADNSLPDYDESAATLLKQRVLAFLKGVE